MTLFSKMQTKMMLNLTLFNLRKMKSTRLMTLLSSRDTINGTQMATSIIVVVFHQMMKKNIIRRQKVLLQVRMLDQLFHLVRHL